MTVALGRRARTLSGRARRKRTLTAWLFALPFVLVFATFMVAPIVQSLAMSFTDFRSSDIRSPFNVNFVGVDQYVNLLGNPEFLKSLLVTGYFVVVGIPLTMVIALVLAVALNSKIVKFRSVFRVGFYTPVVTSIVAVAIVWRFILQPDGLLNVALAGLGIEGPSWLTDPAWALPSLILMAVWRNLGTLMIIFLAGLQTVPEDVMEAASMDGAGKVRSFFSIVIPILRPTLLLGAILLSVGFLQFFEESYVMTQGGPLGSTLSISYYTFNQFGFGNYGTASAASYILFVIIAVISVVQFRLLRSKD
ncbi:sugar ABC transporter permease [Microbacterium foliorum]|uniref:Lactose transport system permease protein LacF n=1 Tax=Microbacterium foliorum TaxID=104336 RepID=A0A0F0KJ36_9MICO|nr:sugar ABC transporter permease [Microbacterium foliorum]AXL11199.1 sugar ABC transporter permease [Microbacterium foliorum]KJL19261.1 Lactose transport system permease protein LacF [Microbacterium foliorum]